MKKACRILLVVILLCVCASAQVNVQPVDPKRESARATLRTFFDAFQQPRVGVTPDPLDEAIKCIDLDVLPDAYRAVKGLETAAQLHEVLVSIANFHIDDAPANR